jgi:nicotinate-nucleotide--dimethylbenzimidazole phosphoribosyltransferase
MADTVVEQVAERLDIPPSEARLVLNALSKLIHQQAEQEGRVRVPGIGIFEHATGDEPLQFTPDAALERVVNHRYAGMAPAAAPPGADPPAALSEASTAAPPVAAETSDVEDDDATSSKDVPAEETLEEDAPEEDAPADGTDAMTAETSGPVASETAPTFPDTAEAEGEAETRPSVRVEDEDAAALPKPEAADEAAPVVASGDASPAADTPDESSNSADGDDQAQSVTEEATPNRAPALIGLILALLLAAGAAWWLLTDEPTTPPETPDTAVVEPEPADETEQTPPDLTTDAADDASDEALDEALDEAAPTPEADVLADGVGTADLPSGAGTIDPALGGFALVVASVPSEEDAEAIEANYREAIANDPLPTALLVSQTGDATRYRVGIGQFATQEEALAVRDARSEVLPGDAWVLRLTPAMARN